MLKKIRITLALFFFVSITLLFLDFTGTVHAYLAWCAKIQFVSAFLAHSVALVLGLVLLTLLFGRIYCSTICPLGVFQDVVSRLAKFKNKARFFYKKPKKALIVLRYALLAIFVLSIIIAGANAIVIVLEPYSAFGRMVSQFLSPVYKYGNNLLAYFAERFDSYAFYSVDIWLKGSVVLALAILTFVVVSIFAYKSGRGYCNSICPVGTFLGLFAKFSFIKPRIDNSKCTHCGLCEKNCKASCVNTSDGKIDYSRCVACFNCISACPRKAIAYAPPQKAKLAENLSSNGLARRNFISGSTAVVLGCVAELHAHRPAADGGLANLEDKKSQRINPIVPAGAISYRNFHSNCTSCQLCVSVCPNNVLSPKKTKPTMSYELGYCRPECVKCSEVCPTGAIKPITVAEKSSIQIGIAYWNKDLCIVNTDKVSCSNCMRHCPTKAISMIPQNANDSASPQIPMIDTERCIGCGACEQLCPARPKSAIHVEGVEVHMGV